MFKNFYTEQALNALVKNSEQRRGWDFSKMNTLRQPVPWKYSEVVSLYLKTGDHVLDIGTGGGETFLKFSKLFEEGVGIDIDPEMINIAQENGKITKNVSFYEDTEKLENTNDRFDVILNRHASFDLKAISDHLKPNGYFITQQVAENNMKNIKQVLNIRSEITISKEEIKESGLNLIAFMEYNVEYVIRDVESFVFWLNALDMLHADLPGGDVLNQVDLFNKMLEGNVDERGFVTNEQRYLVIAQK